MPKEDKEPPPPAVVATMAILRSAGLRDEAVKGMSPRQQDVPPARVRQIAGELLTDMVRKGDQGDLVEDFALPWAARVTCELLGLPDDAAAEITRWFPLFSIGPEADANLPDLWPRSLFRFGDWMGRLKPTGLLPRLIRLNGRSARPLSEQMMVEIGHMLAFSGLGNPAAFLATCGLVLARDRHLTERLQATPGLMPRLVEEIYRWAPLLGDSITRIATEDLDLGGTRIAAGELVLISTDAANHDPAVFPEPERIDPDRPACPHVRFGQGRHYCPAAALNKLQTEAALSALLDVMPGLRLATGASAVTWRQYHAVLMPVAVPVRW
ncbi:cytochrome P450 [Streptomyces sp. MST-110588]|uniref:cytochrome P450 n=1 Tax=Streptomyces sp. MST-110588 TaxID=2833628 RepID=UPI001F5C607E|nr:cytochrome P450 [Streptomyces sp. MST-110588]UNO39308.1 cytochrome P450 [Streptomyces sp. MST-110588]